MAAPAPAWRIQLQLIAIWLFNRLLRWVPGHRARILILNAGGARVSTDSAVHAGCYVTRPGRLEIGAGSTVNFDCYLDTRGHIAIGRNVMLGHRCRIYTAGHLVDDPAFAGYLAPVAVNDHAVVFPNSQLMPGVTVGEGAVVLTGSVVGKDVEPYCVVGGNPARLIRQRQRELAYRHDYQVWLPNV